MADISKIKIADAVEKHRVCLKKADEHKGAGGRNNVVDNKKEAGRSLDCVLDNLAIEDIHCQTAQIQIGKLLKLKPPGPDNSWWHFLSKGEVAAVKKLLIKKYGAMKALSWIVLPPVKPDIVSTIKHKYRNTTKIKINSPWSASWKKVGLKAIPYKNGIKISGTLANDCENYSWIINKKVPQGKKYLAFDVNYSSIPAAWGGKSMFALQVNGKYIKPVNIGSSPDAMIDRHSGTIYFPIDNLDEIKTISIKTFAGKNINLMIQNIRVHSASNKIKTEKAIFSCHVNQLGYAGKTKRAILAIPKKQGGLKPVSFHISEKKSGKKVFTGNSSNWKYFNLSGETYSILDFSSFNKPGDYIITIPAQTGIKSDIKSYDFSIRKKPSDLYVKARNASLRAFQYFRCGHKSHYKCHAQDNKAVIFGTKKTMDVSGGWHDAGDYGKYSVPAAYTLGMLMLGLESFPKAFLYQVADVHNKTSLRVYEIIKPEIQWLLKMQRSDGAVYHKACSAKWPQSNVAPSSDSFVKSVMPISSTATADFAAVMAQTSRIFKQVDPGLAKLCLSASKSAWKFLERNKQLIMIKTTYNGMEYGGPYNDKSDKDERLWAATELWRATNDNKYKSYIQSNLAIKGRSPKNESILDWQNLNFFAYYSFLLGKGDKTGNLKDYLKTYGNYL
ncbi:glycoside hydrolase family 9 protein, partial [Candidatus Margulisiibacteriota bacterium]